MDPNSSFVNLLNSQCSVGLDSPETSWLNSQEVADDTTQAAADDGGHGVRRKWSAREDKILIGAWLNTSKDSVVGNEQKAGAFWKRIQDYYNSNPLLQGTVPRELPQCKQRWQRMNEQVCKFVGCFDAALREQRSGQNDDDVMKSALEIYNNDYGSRFTLEYAWRELRHDKKWCSMFVAKDKEGGKRKQGGVNVDGEERPIGVKAAKAVTKKKKSSKEEEMTMLQGLLEIKEKMSKNKILERLLAKKDPLTELETSLKLKLMGEML